VRSCRCLFWDCYRRKYLVGNTRTLNVRTGDTSKIYACMKGGTHNERGAVGWGTALQARKSRWCHWNFSLTQSFRPQYGRGVDSASNRCEYQEYFLGGKGGWCVWLTTLPPSVCWLSWNLGTSTTGTCSGLYRECVTFFAQTERFNLLEAKKVTSRNSDIFITIEIKSSLWFLVFVRKTSCCRKVKAVDRTDVAWCLDIQSSLQFLPH
jgi:hypothetical protein